MIYAIIQLSQYKKIKLKFNFMKSSVLKQALLFRDLIVKNVIFILHSKITLKNKLNFLLE